MENPRPGKIDRRDRWIALFLFILIILTQFNGKAVHSGDTRWYIPTALSLIHERNTDLDEYRGMITPRDYGIRRYKGHLYNFFPIGSSLIALPFVYTFDQLATHLFGLNLYAEAQKSYLWRLESTIAVCGTGGTVVAVYFLCRLFVGKRRSLMLALIFAYATSTWSTASQTLWQHGPSMLTLTLAFYCLLQAQRDNRWIYAAALPLFFSYTIRPTNAVPVALFSLYVLARYRKQFPLFLAIGLVMLIPLFADCYAKSGRLLDQYYLAKSATPHFTRIGLLGTLVSPGRGLFVYSPIFLFSIVGFLLKVHHREIREIDLLLVAMITFHWISLSLFAINWWGGHSLGPRYFTDMNPFFIFYLIPLFDQPLRLRVPIGVTLYALMGFFAFVSGWIQWRCVSSSEVLLWNVSPIDINLAPQRLWDWNDVPFLRGIQVVNPNTAPAPRASLLFAPNKMNIPFGGTIALRGYIINMGPLLEGFSDRLTLRLYWQALRSPDFDYSVFVHVVDAEGRLITQSDHAPGAVANYPPTYWRRGQVIVDEHILVVPRKTTSGSYAIQVGVYNWATGERLPLEGGQGDSVRLSPAITILPRPALYHSLYIPFIANLAGP